MKSNMAEQYEFIDAKFAGSRKTYFVIKSLKNIRAEK